MSNAFRGVWVSTVVNIDFPTKPGIPVPQMKAEIDSIIAKTAEVGLNAIFLQVRPTTDALYKSSIFPWSAYLTGEQGKAPEGGFDPLSYWIEKCRAANLEIHAWINPYRVAHMSQKLQSLEELAPTNPARLNPDWVVKYEGKDYNGAWYFDPGIPEVRQLIVDGAAELAENYDLDGFHIDDYFYPGMDFDDKQTYEKYGNGLSLDDWRRECVSDLIRGFDAVAKKSGVRFGVSPSGIWMNKASDPRGSDTKGGEHYKSMYADTYQWVKEGWMDYIVPQIYWHIGFEIADYQVLANWWAGVCEGTDVDLYIGMAAYRAADESRPEFVGEMTRQFALNATIPGIEGYVLFTYKNLLTPVGDEIQAWNNRH
ncbi:MAG: family 10 glycosylhydrolase [Defluviitaleaceae bacterium]|nr:family 10 glycosylhydrolase [Defluviitaleaceae bacterium]